MVRPVRREMTDETWASHRRRCLGVRLNGDAIDEIDERGERVVDDTLLVLLNGGSDSRGRSRCRRSPPPSVGNAGRHRPIPWQTAAPAARQRPYPLQGRSVACCG